MEEVKKVNLDEIKQVTSIGKALSSELRIQILQLLEYNVYHINEIAEMLQIPPSSAALHIKVLEEAGLIETELKTAIRGSMKLCKKKVDTVQIDFQKRSKSKVERISMPIGSFVNYKVSPTCGIVSKEGYIDIEDEPAVFYNPRRMDAKLIWIGGGYLEYRFPNAALKKHTLKKLVVSAEICSEDHEYNMEWPSDITLWINEKEAGTWESPSDFGGRQGKLNPLWWPEENTQYGRMKTWSVDHHATYLDYKEISEKVLEDYELEKMEYISIKIGIKDEAKHQGGMNLFGDCFGDYPQDIIMELFY